MKVNCYNVIRGKLLYHTLKVQCLQRMWWVCPDSCDRATVCSAWEIQMYIFIHLSLTGQCTRHYSNKTSQQTSWSSSQHSITAVHVTLQCSTPDYTRLAHNQLPNYNMQDSLICWLSNARVRKAWDQSPWEYGWLLIFSLILYLYQYSLHSFCLTKCPRGSVRNISRCIQRTVTDIFRISYGCSTTHSVPLCILNCKNNTKETLWWLDLFEHCSFGRVLAQFEC